jgi:hypothetical protein
MKRLSPFDPTLTVLRRAAGYSTNLDWHGGPNHGWWVELLKDGERVVYMSLEEWGTLGATQQAIEDVIADLPAEGTSWGKT